VALALEHVCFAGAHAADALADVLAAVAAHPHEGQLLLLVAAPDRHVYRGLYRVVPGAGEGREAAGGDSAGGKLAALRLHGNGPPDLSAVLASGGVREARWAPPVPPPAFRVAGAFRYGTSRRALAEVVGDVPLDALLRASVDAVALARCDAAAAPRRGQGGGGWG
jgi:hypothetical protein